MGLSVHIIFVVTRWEPHLDPDTDPGLVTRWSGDTYDMLATLCRGDTVGEMGDSMSDAMRSVIIIIMRVIIISGDQVQCPETDRDGLHSGGGEPGTPRLGHCSVTISGDVRLQNYHFNNFSCGFNRFCQRKMSRCWVSAEKRAKK